MSVELSWPGKRPPAPIAAASPHLVETFEPFRFANPASPLAPRPWPLLPNSLYHGDNLPILARLLDSGLAGQVRLIYADPPYDSGIDWTRKVRLRRPRRRGVDPVVAQQVQYGDTWPEGAYLQFIYDRLPLLRELLAGDGSLWLHCDHRRAHHLRCLLDEVFGAENYLNTITWRSQTARGAKVNAFYFPNSAHTILVYGRNRAAPTLWHPPRKRIVLSDEEAAAAFMRDEGGFFRTSDPGTYSFDSLVRLHAEGRLYAPYGGEVRIDEAQQRVYASNGGNLGVKYYLADLGDGRHQVERAVDNVWDDIPGLGTTPGEDLGYPTQKTEALLERIIATGSNPGDLVLDPSCGSGTTLAIAEKLGRRWIGCDAGHGAIQTATRRMQAVMTAAASEEENDQWSMVNRQLSTGGDAGDGAVPGSGFAVFETQDELTSSIPAPEVRLSITRIDGEAATIVVAVDAVRVPALDGAAGELADDEWPALVDSIAIDPAYDGQVLRAVVADAPLKKRATVRGAYTVTLPSLPTIVAVRVVDITGGACVTMIEIEGS